MSSQHINKLLSFIIIPTLLIAGLAACGDKAPNSDGGAAASEKAGVTAAASASGGAADASSSKVADSITSDTASVTAAEADAASGADGTAGGAQDASGTVGAAGGANNAQNAPGAPAGDGPFTPFAKTVSLTWSAPKSFMLFVDDGETYDDNRWSKKIKADLNISVKNALTAGADVYMDKLYALFASDDLPDIMHCTDRDFFTQAQKSGHLADITETLNNYASDGIKAYKKRFPESFEGASVYGKLYAFPFMNDNFYHAPFLWIRNDWLANTNSAPPKTIAEMVALARKFTFEDPDKNGVDDTYGLALGKKIVEADYGTILGLISAFGVPGYGPDGIFYWGGDGRLTFAYIQPEMKDALALLRDMYAEGLIDPDFIVKDVVNMQDDVLYGKFGMTYHMWRGASHPFNILYAFKNVVTQPYPIPVIPGVDYKIGVNSNKTGELFLLSSKCKHPEAFVKILNLYNKTCFESDDPEGYIEYWAFRHYNFCPAYVGMKTPEVFAGELREALDKNAPESLHAYLRQMYDNVVNFESGADTGPSAYETWAVMNKRGSVTIAMEDYSGHIYKNVMANQRPKVWRDNAQALEHKMITFFTDVITGLTSVDEFDAFVEDWLSSGGRQTISELERMYRVN